MSYRVISGPHTGLVGDLIYESAYYAVGDLIYESAYYAVLKIDTGEEIRVMKDCIEEVNDDTPSVL